MNFSVLEFSQPDVYLFIFLAIIIFGFFRLMKRIIPLIPVKLSSRKLLVRLMPLVEMFIWLIFFIWSIQFFWNNNQLYAIELSIILAVFIVWISWFSLRDFIAGAMFKANREFSENEHIVIEDNEGKIIGMKSRYLILETEEGENIYIPYSRIIGKKIVKSYPAESLMGHSFTIEIKTYGHADEQIFKSSIKSFILSLPWASITKDPQINPSGITDSGNPIYNITVYTPVKEYFSKIENEVRNRFEN
ncbi:MAG: mechanosensitive ion channel [Bacteroidales bacterium]|nr:mechanosensitive ion channel [Bacteroidales bacterium]